MAELKTKATQKDAKLFLESIQPESKKADGLALLEIFTKVTGESPVMWGESIVGFGMYHYKSERSTQEGDWPLVAFSPRKKSLSLYIVAGNEQSGDLFEKLGKHKKSVGCLYINKLADVDVSVLEALISTSYTYMKKNHKGA